MIFEIIALILAMIVVAAVTYHCNDKVKLEKSKISIKESMDLAQIPIVTFEEGNNKLNFLLDTGSTHSHISKDAAKLVTGAAMDVEYNYTTSMGDANNVSKIIEAVLTYKKDNFKVNLYVNEGLDDSFKSVKNQCGVQLHGIMGSNFLKEYKYILDFAELVAYHR